MQGIVEGMENALFSNLSELTDENLKQLHHAYEGIYSSFEEELNKTKEKLDLINAEFTRRFTDEN